MKFEQIILQQNLGVSSVIHVRKLINDILKHSSFIRIDFRNVKMIDSSGISLLVNCATRLRRINGG